VGACHLNSTVPVVVETRVGACTPVGAIQAGTISTSLRAPSPLKLVADTLNEYEIPGSKSVTK
jgi:hypothetical protein